MSLENIKQFYQLATTDDALRQKLNEINTHVAKESVKPENLKALTEQWVLPIATEYGVPFTYDELMGYNETLKTQQGELSPEELETVAGGIGGGFAVCFIVGSGVYVDFLDALCFFVGI